MLVILGDMPWEVGEPKWGNGFSVLVLSQIVLCCPDPERSPAMSINVEDYFAPETFKAMKAFADQHETPFVVIDTATIARAYDEIAENFPYAKIYYAVKANQP